MDSDCGGPLPSLSVYLANSEGGRTNEMRWVCMKVSVWIAGVEMGLGVTGLYTVC